MGGRSGFRLRGTTRAWKTSSFVVGKHGSGRLPSTYNRHATHRRKMSLEITMKKMMLILAALACTGLCAFGQSSTDAASPNNSGQTAGAPSASSTTSGNASTTLDGCLSGSSGSYTLKDKATGATYNLAGDTSKLDKHVGHEIQVMGTASNSPSGANSSASSTTTGNASSMSGQQTFNVSAVKMVSSSCSAGQ